MMTKLPLSVPLAERETVFSYLNRLAAANGVSARDFCMDLGMSLSPHNMVIPYRQNVLQL